MTDYLFEMKQVQNFLKVFVCEELNRVFLQTLQYTTDIISIGNIWKLFEGVVLSNLLLELLDFDELLRMNAIKSSELIFVGIENNLEFLIKHLFSLNKCLFQRHQTHSVIDQACSVLFFLVYELGHFYKKILVEWYALFAFRINLNNLCDSFYKIFFFSNELILFLLVLC